MTLLGLSHNGESACKREVENLTGWCGEHNLSHNHYPLISSEEVEWVSSNWGSVLGHQHNFCQWESSTANLLSVEVVEWKPAPKPGEYCILACFTSCTKGEQVAIYLVIKTAGKIIGSLLPDINTISTFCSLQRSHRTVRDPSHSSHHLFHVLPLESRFQSIRGLPSHKTSQ